jgi:hypothetical protein
MKILATILFLLLTSTALAEESYVKYLVREECRGGYAYIVKYECVVAVTSYPFPTCRKWETSNIRQLYVNIPTHGLYKHTDVIMIGKTCR